MKLKKIFIYALPAVFSLSSCVDLEYNEVTLRDEDWTYEFFNDGVKNMIWDVYAQMYNNELTDNSTSFLAGATDEAQYALDALKAAARTPGLDPAEADRAGRAIDRLAKAVDAAARRRAAPSWWPGS